MKKVCVNCKHAFVEEDPMYHDTELCCGRYMKDAYDDNYEYVDDDDTCEEFLPYED